VDVGDGGERYQARERRKCGERARLTIARVVDFAHTHFIYLRFNSLWQWVTAQTNTHLISFCNLIPPVRLDNTIRHIYPIANFRQQLSWGP